LGMVVPLATGVSENDDYQRACGRRETPLQGTDSFGSLPANITTGHVAKTGKPALFPRSRPAGMAHSGGGHFSLQGIHEPPRWIEAVTRC
jgi:hypothetical protein